MVNAKASELAGVVGVIDPDAYAAGTVTTGWIDASRWGKLLAIIQAGDLGTGATLDAKIEQATDSAGSGAKDVAGKAITQLTQAGGDSNKQALIDLRPESLDLGADFRYVRLSMTVATAASDAGAVVLGLDPRNGPATDNDLSSVAEIV